MDLMTRILAGVIFIAPIFSVVIVFYQITTPIVLEIDNKDSMFYSSWKISLLLLSLGVAIGIASLPGMVVIIHWF